MNRAYLNNAYRTPGRVPVGRSPAAMTANDCCRTPEAQSGKALAMAYVPSQKFENLYPAAEALRHGTLFADLDLPYCAGGGR